MSDANELAALRARAEAVGLTRLTDAHIEQLKRATEGSARHKSNLTVEVAVADEPAHVYSLVRKGSADD